MKYGVADFGMNVWFGASHDIEERLTRLKSIGYQGIERVYAVSPDDALIRAAYYRRLGCDFATCLGPNPESSLRWTAGLGKEYVWVPGEPRDVPLDVYIRHAQSLGDACARWGIKAALHNHLGQPTEKPEEIDEFLAACPQVNLLLDTAHYAAAGGDPVDAVRRYASRIAAVHLKDWLVTDPTKGPEQWPQWGHFCPLGEGNIGLDNIAVMKALVAVGYDGWVFVEQDTHLRDPFEDLAQSMEYLRVGGFGTR